jgi:hypothetical protein
MQMKTTTTLFGAGASKARRFGPGPLEGRIEAHVVTVSA